MAWEIEAYQDMLFVLGDNGISDSPGLVSVPLGSLIMALFPLARGTEVVEPDLNPPPRGL